ncbi:MAG: alkaline phosphatase family protein [Chloroflexota bacterium]|nr:alkaline phosphatase family protein [Chloroflexota bacterium]
MSTPNQRKVFVIGLDGATYDLIRPWAEQGKLPTFTRLMAEGTWGTLRSVIPPLTPPAWSSFLTGMTPGRHGVYTFLQRKPGSYDLMPFNATFRQVPDMGTILNQHDKQVALVNIPTTYPPKPIDGLMVTGLATPGRNNEFTYPASLGKELIRRFDYEIERPEKYDPGLEDSFIAAVNRVEDKRLRATLWLMDELDWSLFAVVFRGTDVLGHAMWRHMDPQHPAHEPELFALYGDALLKHYQRMDQAIGEICTKLDSETILMMVSDHGFGPIYRDVYIDNVLAESGLLHIKKTRAAQFRSALVKMGISPRNILRLLGALRLRNLTRKLIPQNARLAINVGMLMLNHVDWSRTRAYPLGGGGQISINLEGREPEGIVKPGTEYEQVCSQIEAALQNLRDPSTGEPIVERVWRKEEIYEGQVSELIPELPDLYVEWTNDRYTDAGGIGYSRGTVSEPIRGRSGGHTMRGMFLAHGQGIKQGHVIEGAKLVDAAPTILHILGVPIPSAMDGQVLTDTFGDTLTRTVQYQDSSMPEEQQSLHVFSSQEQAMIEQRLHDLGYI